MSLRYFGVVLINRNVGNYLLSFLFADSYECVKIKTVKRCAHKRKTIRLTKNAFS